jgi:hypothetical protein
MNPLNPRHNNSLQLTIYLRGLSSIGTKNRVKDSELLETRFRGGFLHEEKNLSTVH